VRNSGRRRDIHTQKQKRRLAHASTYGEATASAGQQQQRQRQRHSLHFQAVTSRRRFWLRLTAAGSGLLRERERERERGRVDFETPYGHEERVGFASRDRPIYAVSLSRCACGKTTLQRLPRHPTLLPFFSSRRLLFFCFQYLVCFPGRGFPLFTFFPFRAFSFDVQTIRRPRKN
jgi:hypothetical protein